MEVGSILTGIFAALPTPQLDDGRPDVAALSPLLDLLINAGVAGFCVGGVTGEYACFTVEERIRVLRHVSSRVAASKPLICGIGAENWHQVLRMAEAARDANVSAVLLPPPSSFGYNARDLKEILRQVALEIRLPVLLYHIPQFTNSLLPSDVVDLIGSVEYIVGVKDSSGQRETLTHFSETKRRKNFVLMVGSDDLLLPALESNAQGGISGTCSVFPELVLGIYQAFRNADWERAASLQSVLQAFVKAISDLPTPWGIKIALEIQGFSLGQAIWPAGPELRARVAKFRQWLEKWMPTIRAPLLESRALQPPDKARE